MAKEVLLTGLGIVSPIGIGAEQVAKNLEARRSGVVAIDSLKAAGWVAPFGGIVSDFEPKAHVKPRKSLKIMSRETQLAFAAGEQAWANAKLDQSEVDPERVGIIGAAGLQYCPLEELSDPIAVSDDGHGNADLNRWGEEGMSKLYPLWLLKYLPNMAACHVGIRRDARGPTNTIAHGDTSSLNALGEACEIIRRGDADVMIAGGSSSRIDLTHLLWSDVNCLSKSERDPAAACRPFDAQRDGMVNAEGAAYFVLESREHAERRGVGQRGELKNQIPWAQVEKVTNRFEAVEPGQKPTGKAIANSIQAVMQYANLTPDDLAMVKAHGSSRILNDAIEAKALQQVIGNRPVTAPTSYFGSAGSAGGSIELALALIGWQQGFVPATLNYDQPDPECPLNVSGSHRDAEGKALLAVNYSLTGQAAAALLTRH